MVSMGTVWDRTAEFLSDNLGAVLPIALLAFFVPSSIMGSLTELQQDAEPGLKTVLLIANLVLSALLFWGQLAITALALDPSLGRGATAVATRRFPAGVLVAILLFVAMMLCALPAIGIAAAYGYDFAALAAGQMPPMEPQAGLWIALYSLILIPALFWIGARLAVVTAVVVGERIAIGSIARSFRLTRGHALRIVGVLLLYIIVSSVANLAARSGFGAILYVVAGGGADGMSLPSVLTAIVGAAVSTAFTVLGTSFLAKLYVALIARSEAVQPR